MTEDDSIDFCDNVEMIGLSSDDRTSATLSFLVSCYRLAISYNIHPVIFLLKKNPQHYWSAKKSRLAKKHENRKKPSGIEKTTNFRS